jgi:TetR/AcrR family transcriptional repressor of lmrAB and yxaGH operons
MATDTKARMISAAISLLQRNGLAAMSFTDVLAESGAARGAIYHHFPGGKQQLALEAARRNAEDIRGYLSTLRSGNPRMVVRSFLDNVRPVVEASARGGGCAIAAVAAGGGAAPGPIGLRDTAGAAFTAWTSEVAAKLTQAGMTTSHATDLASLMIVTLEGAHILCRAAGSIAPFDRAATALLAGVEGDGSSNRHRASHPPSTDRTEPCT